MRQPQSGTDSNPRHRATKILKTIEKCTLISVHMAECRWCFEFQCHPVFSCLMQNLKYFSLNHMRHLPHVQWMKSLANRASRKAVGILQKVCCSGFYPWTGHHLHLSLPCSQAQFLLLFQSSVPALLAGCLSLAQALQPSSLFLIPETHL